jgi:hypothetical protein
MAIAPYDHVQQLRAELGNSGNADEIRQIKAELATDEAKQVLLHGAFAAWLEDET